MIRTTLGIEGMMCGMCEAHINDAIRKRFAVKSVTSSRAKRQTVIVSEQPLDPELLGIAIRDTGYELTDISSEPYEKRGLLAALRKK